MIKAIVTKCEVSCLESVVSVLGMANKYTAIRLHCPEGCACDDGNALLHLRPEDQKANHH